MKFSVGWGKKWSPNVKVGYAVLMKPFPMVNGKDLVQIFTVIKVKSAGLWGWISKGGK